MTAIGRVLLEKIRRHSSRVRGECRSRSDASEDGRVCSEVPAGCRTRDGRRRRIGGLLSILSRRCGSMRPQGLVIRRMRIQGLPLPTKDRLCTAGTCPPGDSDGPTARARAEGHPHHEPPYAATA